MHQHRTGQTVYRRDGKIGGCNGIEIFDEEEKIFYISDIFLALCGIIASSIQHIVLNTQQVIIFRREKTYYERITKS